MRTRQAVLSSLLCVTMLGTNIGAQQHVIEPEVLQQLLDTRLAEEQAQRAAIRRTLDHPDVKRVAHHLGVDLQRAIDGVSTIDGVELAEISARAQAVDTALSGGHTVTFSTATIIIILLVAILIIVAVD